jgi:hypothetical protein
MVDAFKKAAEKAKEKVGPDKVAKATEAIGGKAKEMTGGKHADKIEKGGQMLRERMEKGRSTGDGR